MAPECQHKDAVCRSCGKKGHLEKVCRSKIKDSKKPQTVLKHTGKPNKTHHLDEGKDDDEYNMFTVKSTTNQPLALPVTLNDVNLTMEIDTDAAKSVISENTFTQL